MVSVIPLWRQLQAAASVVQAVRSGRSLSDALPAVDVSLRPGVQALSFHALRQLGRAEALRRLLAKRPPPPPADALLCTALALGWREADAPYEVFTLVDQTVEAAKRDPATRAQASFVNACLRRFLRERDALVDSATKDPVAVWNHPRWWIERLRKDHPQHWQTILRANNRQAPMVLRVFEQKVPRVEVQRSFIAMNIVANEVGEHGLQLVRPLPVQQIPGFSEGAVSVQDSAAQLAAPLLLRGMDRTRPARVLDACAAPGGKTAHLLELALGWPGFQVTALDIDAARCSRIHDNLLRQGLTAQVVVADAARPATWWPHQCDSEPFDAILLDAPCTASGIVRRHPDVRWLRRETDIAQLAATQAALLAALWPLLKDGGRLLYCTCSVFRAEGEQQIQTFLAHHTDAVLLPSPGHLMPHTGANDDAVPDNLSGDHDGFFYALLGKCAPPRPAPNLGPG